MKYEREIEEALRAARAAGDLLAREYETFAKVADAPADITTEADRKAQEAILGHLFAAFPNDAFAAEEDTPTLSRTRRAGPRLWIIDPIDGTRGFARKNGEFSVMIALLDQGQVALGVVLEPIKCRLTYAVRGGGCWRRDGDGTPLRCAVSRTSELAVCTLTQSHSKNPAEPSGPVRALGPRRVIETYSAGVKLALVARGEADIYVNNYPAFSDWDICAGDVLVTEAGGQVSGLKGEQIVYGGQPGSQRCGLLATNGTLHPQAVARLSAE